MKHNLCDLCTNKACVFQSGILRSECDFYIAPMPHLESDNCGNYVVQQVSTCEDCVSRKAVIDAIEFYKTNPQHFTFENLIYDIKSAWSVQPVQNFAGMTNGDVIKALFPNVTHDIWHTQGCDYVRLGETRTDIKLPHWWSAPYKVGDAK